MNALTRRIATLVAALALACPHISDAPTHPPPT